MTKPTMAGLPVADASPRVAFLLGQRTDETETVIVPQVARYPRRMELSDDINTCGQRPEVEMIRVDATNPFLARLSRPDAAPVYCYRVQPRFKGDPAYIRLGKCSELPVAEARVLAQRMHDDYQLTGQLQARPKRGLSRATFGEALSRYSLELGLRGTPAARETISRMERFALPILRDQRLATIRGATWSQVTTRVGVPSKANRLHKDLRALMNWAVREGYADANPMARMPPPFASARKRQSLDFDEIIRIATACDEVAEPFRTIVLMVIATGETVTNIREVQRDHIDVEHRDWFKFHLVDQGEWGEPDMLSVPLSPYALCLSKPHLDKPGFLFPSPRMTPVERPMFLRSPVIDQLKRIANLSRDWCLSDLRRAVIGFALAGASDPIAAWDAWGQRISTAIENERHSVVL